MEHQNEAGGACHRCGVGVPADTDGLPLTWSVALEGDHRRVLCDRCTRDHLRAIEGKLDEAWW